MTQHPGPYPTTVEEILAAAGLTAAHTTAAPPVALVVPQPGTAPALITTAGHPAYAPQHYAPTAFVLPVPQPLAQQPQPAPAQASAWTDTPLWLRASIVTGSVGIGTAGVGIGIGQAAPGLDAAARFLLALAAVFGVGVVGWVLAQGGRRQQAGPAGAVTHITTNVTANITATASSVGRQRNR
ncbi:hypothetical protein ACFWNL_18265 [Kitasatospora sp. NPDC058397]|uniref:hypothetical protein n=1 Tax=unclassified Kitasatospora TaxID=2633591 RepID=UPI003660C768